MENKEFLKREIELLRTVPKDKLGEYIERNGQQIREILTDHEEYTNAEIKEALKVGYLSL